MGKKKIIKQTQEEALKETETQAELQKKAVQSPAKSGKKSVSIAKVIVRATYNNVVISLTDTSGNMLAWSTSGSLGFKGPKKSTPFAASKVAETISEKAAKIGVRDLYVSVKGVGSGRDAAVRLFGARGFNILSIKDITPIPHNGCRPPKPRRV